MGGPGEKEKFTGQAGGLSEQAAGGPGVPGAQSTSTTGKQTGGKTGRKETEQGVPGMVVGVEIPGDPKEEKKKSKSSKSKKKPTKEQKKAAEVKELTENLSLLLKAGFDIVAMRLGPVWQVTDDEVEKITSPLARILDRYGCLDTVSEYSDFIALGMGVTMTVVPRVLISREVKRKGVEVIGPRQNDTKTETNISNTGAKQQGGSVPGHAGDVKNLVPGLA